MGEGSGARAAEEKALRTGIELGMSVIDTAEMYGDGETERFLGGALAGLRERVYLVSKVYPHNAGRGRIERACEASLRRLKTDHLDLYLLHWRGSIPLAEIVEGMEAMVTAGKIGAWGVSNLDVGDMEELVKAGGQACATDQILYNVSRRGPEFELLPELLERAIPAMAYSPVEQGRLSTNGALFDVAERHAATPYQVALAWVLRRPSMIAVPKAATVEHVQENSRAADLQLTPEDLARIDIEFRPPTRRTRLEML